MPHRRLLPERGFARVLVAIMAVKLAQKRERDLQTIEHLLDSGCPLSKLLRTQLHGEDEEVGLGKEWVRKKIRQRLHAVDSIQTPYGSLIEELEAPYIGEPVKLSYINPFALLYYASSMSREFYDWMCSTIPTGGGRIALYADEVSPSDGFKV